MNHCILTGNLGADPKIFWSPDGKAIASFNLAFKSMKDKTSWVKVTCFNKLAEVSEKYLHKGAKITIAAVLDQENWETEQGEKRTTLRLIANKIEFLKTDGRGFTGTDKENEVEDQGEETAPF